MENKLFAVYCCFGLEVQTTRAVMPATKFMTAIKLALGIDSMNLNFADDEQFVAVIEIEPDKYYEGGLQVEYGSVDTLPNAVLVRRRTKSSWKDKWVNKDYQKVWESEKVPIDEETAKANTTFTFWMVGASCTKTSVTPTKYEHVCLDKADYKDGLDLMRAWDGEYDPSRAPYYFLGKWGGNRL
jgi:hypothetical protein